MENEDPDAPGLLARLDRDGLPPVPAWAAIACATPLLATLLVIAGTAAEVKVEMDAENVQWPHITAGAPGATLDEAALRGVIARDRAQWMGDGKIVRRAIDWGYLRPDGRPWTAEQVRGVMTGEPR